MTAEELRRKLNELDEETKKDETPKTEIEAPKEEATRISFSSANELSEALNKIDSMVEQPKTDFQLGREQAQETSNAIKKNYNRDELTELYNTYSGLLSKAAERQDAVEYYKDRAILDDIETQMKKTSSVASFLTDFQREEWRNIGLATANAEQSLQRIYENTKWVDANALKRLASADIKKREGEQTTLGKAQQGLRDNFINPAFTLNDNYMNGRTLDYLVELHKNNPNDEIITNLYDTVVNKKYTGNDKYFKAMADYATELLRTQNYENSSVYKGTRDEEERIRNLKTAEELSYGPGEKAILSGVGTASYMIPSVLTSIATSGLGEVAGASAGAVSKLGQAGSLASMYLSSSGNAFEEKTQSGYGWNKANTYARLIGALETATELVGGENVNAALMGTFTHTATSKVAQSLIAKGKNAVQKFMISVALDVGAEATEEMMSAMLEPIINKAVLNEDTSVTEYFQGILDAGLSSVLPTLIMGGFGKARSIQTVNDITSQLYSKIVSYNEFMTNEEIDKLVDDLNKWREDAIAGIDTHYDEIKDGLEKSNAKKTFEEAMGEMDTALEQRRGIITDIVRYAANQENMDNISPAQKQANVQMYAESLGIDKETLKILLGNQQSVFPQDFNERTETWDRFVAANKELSQIYENINAQNQKAKQGKALWNTFFGEEGKKPPTNPPTQPTPTPTQPSQPSQPAQPSQPSQPSQPTNPKPSTVDSSKAFDSLKNKYGTVKSQTVNGQKFEYITIDDKGSAEDKRKGNLKFYYSNPEVGKDIGSKTATTQDALNQAPVALINRAGPTTTAQDENASVKIFKNVDDALKYAKAMKAEVGSQYYNYIDKRFIIKSASGNGAYFLKRTGKDEFAWYSEFDGQKVGEKTNLDNAVVGDYVTAFKNIPDIPGHNPNLMGKTFTTKADLAELLRSTVYPMLEYDRFIFTKNKKIVGLETVTSLEPGLVMPQNDWISAMGYLINKAKSLGADKVYTSHNHPGHSDPSSADRHHTASISRAIKARTSDVKYGGEIVIGLDDYSILNPSGTPSVRKEPYEGGKEYSKDFFKNEAWIKSMPTTPTELISLSEKIPSQSGYTKAIFTDFDWHPRVIMNIKDTFLLGDEDTLNNYLHDLAVEFGCNRVDYVTENKDVFKHFKDMRTHMGVLVDSNNNKLDAYTASRRNDTNAFGHSLADKGGDKNIAYWLTPEDEMVDDKSFLGRDKKQTESKKKERGTTLNKNKRENNTFADKVKPQETEKDLGRKLLNRYMAYKPSDMEEKGSPTIEKIEKRNAGLEKREPVENKVSIKQISREISRFLKGRVGRLRGGMARSAYGTYADDSKWVRVKQEGNISTKYHELGHYLRFNVFKDVLGDSTIDNELIKLCKDSYENRYTDKSTQLEEGFAEATRYFVEAPEVLEEKAPNVYKMFESLDTDTKIQREAKDFLVKLQNMTKDYVNLPQEERVDSLIDWVRDPIGGRAKVRNLWQSIVYEGIKKFMNADVALIEFDRDMAKKRGQKYNDTLSINRLFDVVRTVGNNQKIINMISHGIFDEITGDRVTDEGLADIVDDIRKSCTKEEAKKYGLSVDELFGEKLKQLGRYALARRTAELYYRRDKEYNTGILKSDMSAILEKYKDNKLYNDALGRISKFSSQLMNYMANKGLITQKEADEIINSNIMYIPMNRVLDDAIQATNRENGSVRSPLKQLRGSDRQIANPFESLITNWGTMLTAIQNNVAYQKMIDIARQSKDYGDWFDTNVSPTVIKKAEIPLSVFKSALRSELGKLENITGQNYMGGDVVDLMNLEAVYNLFTPTIANPRERVVSYLEKGKRKYIQFTNNDLGESLYEVMSKIGSAEKSNLLNIFEKINTPLKLGATAWNLEFSLSNMQADEILRWINSDSWYLTIPYATSLYNVAKLLRARGSVIAKPFTNEKLSEMYEKFKRSGADQSGKFTAERNRVDNNFKEVFGKTQRKIFGKPDMTGATVTERATAKAESFSNWFSKVTTSSAMARLFSYIPELSEQATRFAEFVSVYNTMKAKGFSEAEAVMEAGMKARRVTQDFTIQGELTRELNKLVPFSSATVGGLYRFGQEMRDHPGRLSARLAILGSIAMLINWLTHQNDDKDWYNEISAQKKFDNFILPTGDDTHFLVYKKPQGPLRYFVNLTQLIGDAAMGYIPEDKFVDKYYEWLKMSMDDALPVTNITDLTPSALKALLENEMNKDFYYGSAIVPKGLEKLDPKNQYDEKTSEVAKAIGKVFNWSPMKIDNFMKKVTAGTGKNVLKGIDYIVRGTSENEGAKPDVSDMFLGGKFFTNAATNSTSINDVYDRIDYLENEKAEGRMTPEETREYSKLQTGVDTLARLNEEKKAAQSDSKLNAEQKREKLDELQELRVETAKYYLGKDVPKAAKEKIELMEYYPSKETFSYTPPGQKKSVEVTVDSEEYAKEFKKELDERLAKLYKSKEYQNASDEEKIEKEKNEKQGARTATTNKMKKKAWQNSLKK